LNVSTIAAAPSARYSVRLANDLGRLWRAAHTGSVETLVVDVLMLIEADGYGVFDDLLDSVSLALRKDGRAELRKLLPEKQKGAPADSRRRYDYRIGWLLPPFFMTTLISCMSCMRLLDLSAKYGTGSPRCVARSSVSAHQRLCQSEIGKRCRRHRGDSDQHDGDGPEPHRPDLELRMVEFPRE
jgi:hypothetical protein